MNRMAAISVTAIVTLLFAVFFLYPAFWVIGDAFKAPGGGFTGWGPYRSATVAPTIDEWTHLAPRWLAAMPKPVGILVWASAGAAAIATRRSRTITSIANLPPR